MSDELPPDVEREVRRLLRQTARRLLAEELDAEASVRSTRYTRRDGEEKPGHRPLQNQRPGVEE